MVLEKGGGHLGHEQKTPLQDTNAGLRVGIEIVIKRGKTKILTEREREVGEDGHNHVHDLDPDPDPDLGTKASHSLEMRGTAIHLLDGKNGGQMTVGEVLEEMIGTEEMNKISLLRA